ncbi:hypothetical protein [Actinokineospora sp.]|uniref:hypothetical protein n=1 Tax=Actinokineospora sp. TaxID=1872133 RepID=UPI003D6B6BE4
MGRVAGGRHSATRTPKHDTAALELALDSVLDLRDTVAAAATAARLGVGLIEHEGAAVCSMSWT